MSEISTYVSFCPARPAAAGPRRLSAARPARGDPEADGAEPVPRGDDGAARRLAPRSGADARLLAAAEETAAAFRGEWFVTGDRARMDEDGAIAHLGRADDVMNAGGFRVSPAEVEAALLAHPGVAEAAAVERAGRPGVTVIAAFYVPRDGPVPEAELAAHCAGRLARYKCPRMFRAVEALPRSANGKLLRRQLREARGWPSRREVIVSEGRRAPWRTRDRSTGGPRACASSRRRSSTSTRRRRPGMTRAAAINHAKAGANKLWAGTVSVAPNAKTGAHHHGHLESIIYVVSGRARMRWGERLEFTAEAEPGDFIFVPPYVPHQEINALTGEPLNAWWSAATRRRWWSTSTSSRPRRSRRCAGSTRTTRSA